MKSIFIISTLLSFVFIRCQSNNEAGVATKVAGTEEQSLVKMLGEIDYEDQRYRLELDEMMNSSEKDSLKLANIWKKIRIADSINRIKIFALLDTAGWPKKSVIGIEGAITIWAVIQHAKPEAREKYFSILQKAVKDADLDAKYLAYTEDRILTDKGLKQKYGTQLYQNLGEKPYLLPLENPEKVDSLRSTVYLPPLSVYLKNNAEIDWNLEIYYKDLPKAEKVLNEDRQRYLNKDKNK